MVNQRSTRIRNARCGQKANSSPNRAAKTNVAIKNFFIASFFSALAFSSEAVTLTFDDVEHGNYLTIPDKLPSPYNDYYFHNTIFASKLAYSSLKPISGDYVGLNYITGTTTITKIGSRDFMFGGTWIAKFVGENAKLTVEGFNNGSKVWEEIADLTPNFTHLDGLSIFIDELRFTNYEGGFILDDLVLKPPELPEPASLGLVILGLLSLAITYRAKKAVK